MNENDQLIKRPVSIIQEIENQLEEYLRRQREEIEKSLEDKIQKEGELARQQLAEIERAVKEEWQALQEYSDLWQQFEDKRQVILRKIQQCLQRIAERQQEIENLTRATAEDIRSISQLNDGLEELRRQSLEQAGELKKGLEERFGLQTEELQPERVEGASLDLTPELEKLKKVKELLLMESGISPSEPPAVTAGESEIEVPEKLEPEPQVEYIPEPEKAEQMETAVSEQPVVEPSLEEKLAKEIRKTITEKLEARPAETAQDTEVRAKSGEDLAEIDRQALEEFYREEPANGSSPIGFYQRGKKNILDAEELLTRLKESVDEARKLIYKMAFISDSKEQFYLKQEIISLQEGLRRFLLRIVFLVSKKNFRFPALTQDILNTPAQEELSDLLAVQNWSLADDLSRFEQRVLDLTVSFKARNTPASIYYGSLRKELEV